MRIQLIFENDACFDWHMIDNDFVRRWCNLLKEYVTDDQETFVYQLTNTGFGNNSEFEKLSDTIQKINFHRPDTIPSNYVKNTFTISELSELHYIYEKIVKDIEWPIGNLPINQAWKYRSLLNDHIHQSESRAGGGRKLPRTRFRIVDPNTGVPNTRKIDFVDDDYNLFTPIVSPYTMYLNYNAEGEDFIKAFKSGRSPKDAVPLRQYSPSFFFVLNTMEYDIQQAQIRKCLSWMKSDGIDTDDSKNSFGDIPLGHLFKTHDEQYYVDALLNSSIRDIQFYE